MLLFRRYSLPIGICLTAGPSRAPSPLNRAKAAKCDMCGDTGKQLRHQVAIFREDEGRVANQRLRGIIGRRDIAGGRWGPGSR
jgi:hypothetical protein